MNHTASSLVPGISRYPDLAQQLTAKLGTAGCCGHANLARDFRKRLQSRLERDKLLKKL